MSNDEVQKRTEDLTVWWMDRAQDEANKVARKAAEYGNNSMIEVGHQLAKMQSRTVTDEEAAEMACYFYIVGKMGRWSDALARGERVSADTLYDVGVYVRMAQRIREAGGWPGTTLAERESAVLPVHNHGPNDGPPCKETRTISGRLIGACLVAGRDYEEDYS